MFDFEFHNPTRIIFGKGKESVIGQELSKAGISKVLVVYGSGSVKRTGLLDRVLQILSDNSIQVVEYAGVVSNPVLSHTRRGVELAKQEKVEAILAIGGGSVLDESKAIAAGAMVSDDIWNYFIDKDAEVALPIYAILTLAATGSEMNGTGVVTNEETKQKYPLKSLAIYPTVSILNPELTFTVPPDYSAYAAVDAIAHVIEGYFTKTGGPVLQDLLVESIIRTVLDTSAVFMAQPDNYNARAEFMWAATLALNGLTVTGITGFGFPNHMIEHSLSAIYNVPHGAGLAIVIPAWMKWYSKDHPEQFDRFAREIFGVSGADAGIEALEKWYGGLNVPTRLGQVNIPESDIDMIAANAHDTAVSWGIGKRYTASAIAEILRLAV
jgi:alcohol dehydrogenase YqhD (iron-dependent ADH family)